MAKKVARKYTEYRLVDEGGRRLAVAGKRRAERMVKFAGARITGKQRVRVAL